MSRHRLSLSLTALLLFIVAVTCHTLQSSSSKAVTRNGNRARQRRQQSSLLLVTQLDGKLLALDPELGTVNWSLDLGSPLLSSSGIWYENSPQNKDPISHSILPGADGSLYIFKDALGASQALERLPASVPELVEASPSVAEDGAVLTGTHQSSVYVVDGKTGNLLRVLPSPRKQMLDQYSPGEVMPARLDLTDAVLLGRQDFTVRSFDAVLGHEKWNVTYAELKVRPFPPLAMAHSNSMLPPIDPVDADLMGITAGPLNTLHRHDPQSGVGLWTLQLDSPAVAVHLADGTSLQLHGSGNTADDTSSVVVGTLHGSMYALPVAADWLQSGLPVASTAPQALDYQPASGNTVTGSGTQSHVMKSPQQPVRSGPQDSAGPESAQHAQHEFQLLIHDNKAAEANGAIKPATGPDCKGRKRAIERLKRQGQTPGPGASTALMQLPEKAEWASPISLHSVVINAAPQSFLPNLTDAICGGDADQQPSQAAQWNGTRALTYVITALLMLLVFITAVAVFIRTRKPSDEASSVMGSQKPGSITNITAHSASEASRLPEQGNCKHDETGVKAVPAGKKAKRKGHSNKYSVLRTAPDKVKDTVAFDVQTAGMAASRDGAPPAKGKPVQAAAQEDNVDKQGARMDKGSDAAIEHGRAVKARITRSDGTMVIGHMEVGPGVLGYGSQGTMVYEGSLHGRPVAVKRMLAHLYHLAKKEIDALILSDEHACVVRCFALEEDGQFVYLALERCKQSLADLLSSSPPLKQPFVHDNGHPTLLCMQVAEDIGQGLLALHERGIVHRDLKPHNVLLTGGQRGKVSDMGHCKRLLDHQASFESLGAGGSSGWQAPEQLIARSGGDARQGYAIDVFSYGMLLFYCLTAGKHPFGEHYERDFNILQGRFNLKAIAHLPEAADMIKGMLAPDPRKRPSIRGIMQQPLWWSPACRLAFLIHLSDRVEMEDREVDQSLLRQLEAVSAEAVGSSDWTAALDPDVVANLGKYRKYNGGSLRDLLRVIRNKHNHFREMPLSLQQKLGALPEGFLRYFTARFPSLLLTTYRFVEQFCSADPPLRDYFSRVPPQQGVAPFPVPSVQHVGAAFSKEQLLPAPQGPLRSPTTHQSDVGLVSEPVTFSSGRPGRACATSGSHEGIKPLPGIQSWDSLFPAAPPPPSLPEQHRSHALPKDTTHPHRRIWWPRQNPDQPQNSTDDAANICSPLHVSPDSHLADADRPPTEALSMTLRGASTEEPCERQAVSVQQEASSSKWSKRPAAASAAWATGQQQLLPLHDHIKHHLYADGLDSRDGPHLQLDDAWPSLQASSGLQQQQQQQQPAGLQQLLHAETRIGEGDAQVQLHVQKDAHSEQQQQGQQHQSSSEDTAWEERQKDPALRAASASDPDQVLGTLLPNQACALPQTGAQAQATAEGTGSLTGPFPHRPGHSLCDFYVRTGFCKFGQGCKFDHPSVFAVCLNSLGLPLRANEQACPFYAKSGACKFGPSCKFDHPEQGGAASVSITRV